VTGDTLDEMTVCSSAADESVNGEMLQQVKLTCHGVAAKATDVVIDDEAIRAFCTSVNVDVFTGLTHETARWPLQFGSLEIEVNFISVLNLLNFGSGYRKELHVASGRVSGLVACGHFFFGCIHRDVF
jgi:hypothetical protein